MFRRTRASAKSSTALSRPVPAIPGIGKIQAEKFLAKVPEEKTFWCNDGTILRDLKGLQDVLATMSDQTFAYHSNDVKKDFSNWVRDVIGDYELAKDLERASNRDQAARIVKGRYTYLTSRLA